MLEIWCFPCNTIREVKEEENASICPKCKSEEIEWLEPEEELTQEDIWEWQYGNDYDKFVK